MGYSYDGQRFFTPAPVWSFDDSSEEAFLKDWHVCPRCGETVDGRVKHMIGGCPRCMREMAEAVVTEAVRREAEADEQLHRLRVCAGELVVVVVALLIAYAPFIVALIASKPVEEPTTPFAIEQATDYWLPFVGLPSEVEALLGPGDMVAFAGDAILAQEDGRGGWCMWGPEVVGLDGKRHRYALLSPERGETGQTGQEAAP